MKYLLLYLVTIPLFAIIDLLWIGVIANRFYIKQVGHLMGEVNWKAAIIFYFLYVAGLLFFAVIPAISAHSLSKAILLGALLGLFAYATYNLTNWATLRDWPAIMVLVDVAWGMIFSASIAGLAYFLSKWLI